MKILVIGDPHGNLEKIKQIPMKEIELILLTGDIGQANLARKRFFENVKRKKEGLPKLEYTAKEKKEDYLEIHNSTLNVLKYLSKKADVYMIAGNVGIASVSDTKKENEKYDLNLPSTISEINKLKNAHLIKNYLRNLNNLKVGFLEYFVDTSWVKEFKPKDYDKSMRSAKKQTEKAEKILERFGRNLDILVCHQPPYGYLDKVNFPGVPESWKWKHAGSKAILDYIKKYQPKYVFCGHIHEGEGKAKIGETEVYNLGVAGYKIIDI
jgi:Icc-related predicted phosphoesterase